MSTVSVKKSDDNFIAIIRDVIDHVRESFPEFSNDYVHKIAVERLSNMFSARDNVSIGSGSGPLSFRLR